MNVLNIKTDKGIDKYTLYESLKEVVGKKIKKIVSTNEEEIDINNSIVYSVPLTKNEDTIVSNKSTCTVKVKAPVCFSETNPMTVYENEKEIVLSFLPTLFLNKEAALLLKGSNFPFYSGKIHVCINLKDANIFISKVNDKEIDESVIEGCVYLNDETFSNFIIKENYDEIFNFYTTNYGDSWKQKLEEDIKNSIECYYQEDEVELKYEIKDKKINFLIEDIWLNDKIYPNELKLDYSISYFDFKPEDINTACIKKEKVNSIFDYKELNKMIEFKKINSKTDLSEYYILQTLDSYEYLFFKDRIDGDVINIHGNYILKTAGNSENIFEFKKETIFSIVNEIKDINILPIYNKFPYKKGMCILVKGGEGESGEGEYSYKGEEGKSIKYEFPSILTNDKYLISLSKCGNGEPGEEGKIVEVTAKSALSEEYAIVRTLGKKGGEGGDSIKLTVNFGNGIEENIAEGGKGGEGENIISHLINNNKTIEEKWKADFIIYS